MRTACTGVRGGWLLLVLALGAHGGPAEVPLEAPLGLSDPDGLDLELRSLDIRLASHGPLALTQFELVFANPRDRQIEGRFRIQLPGGAAISRFAKEVGGSLMEGEVVERLRANRIYTEILHTMQDPALLEQDQGNRFKARIFPIPPRGTVRILFAYSTVNPIGPDGRRRIVVPVRGLPRIGSFRFLAVCRPLPGETLQLTDASGRVKPYRGDRILHADEARSRDFVPAEDIVLSFAPDPGAPAAYRLKAGPFEMVAWRAPAVSGEAAPRPDHWEIFVDTSASRFTGGSQALEALAGILDRLAAQDPARRFELASFDLAVRDRGSWTGTGSGREALEAIRRDGFLGATDLGAVLKRIGERARASAAAGRTFVLVTDAIPTLGTRDRGELLTALGSWPASCRLHVLVPGSLQDAATARALARAGNGRVIGVALGASAGPLDEAAAALERGPGTDYRVEDAAASWIQPDGFEDVTPGQELIAFVHAPAGGQDPGDVGDGPSPVPRADAAGPRLVGATGEVPALPEATHVADEFAPLLEREAVRAQLDHLEAEEDRTDDPARRSSLRTRRIELSEAHRVLCPLTALIVLESEADYRRYGIDRRSLADILTVSDSGIEVVRRRGPAATPVPPDRTKNRDTGRPEPRKANGNQGLTGGTAALSSRRDGPAEPVGADRAGGSSPAELEGDDPGEAAPGGVAGPAPTARSVEAMDGSQGWLPAAATDVAASEDLEEPRAMENLDAAGAPPPGTTGGLESDEEPLLDLDAPETAEDAPAASQTDGADLGGGGAARAERREVPAGELHDSLAPAARPQAPPPRSLAPETRSRVAMLLDHRPAPVPAPSAAAARPDGPPPAPDWTAQATWKPDESHLQRLGDRVRANPLDRTARTALAHALLRAGHHPELETMALDWQRYDPENPVVYEVLGRVISGRGDEERSLRALSTIAEVSPSDAGLLDRAGHLALCAGLHRMAGTLFRAAIERRPDNANHHRGLALALLMERRHEEAARVLAEALDRVYHDRYGDVKRILREELGLVLGSWLRADSGARSRIDAIAGRTGADPAHREDLRITLHWETDASDVDLHVVDPTGEECFYSHKVNRSGLTLYEDLTQGLGPETTVVPTGRLIRGVYHIGVKYFRAGPMGVSRGIVVVHRRSPGGDDEHDIEPFILLPDLDGVPQDMRHLMVFEASP